MLSCPHPALGAGTMVLLPSLALALLCLLRAGAEVPVQPGFSAEKVTAQGATGAAWAGGAARGRVTVLRPRARPGYCPEGGMPAQIWVSPGQSCPLWPDPAVSPPQGHEQPGLQWPQAGGISPGNTGQMLRPPSWHRVGQSVLHAGGWQVPASGWQVPTMGYQVPTMGYQVPTMGCQVPHRGWQVPHCRLAGPHRG